MRDILFRGKRTDNGEWVQGYYLFDISEDQPRIATDYDYSTGTHYSCHAPRQKIVDNQIRMEEL